VSHMSQTEKSVIPFAPTDKGNDQLDKAGQSILNLLHKAAGVAEKHSQHALDIAQQLSNQLRAAEQRIADLEAEAERHRDRAERAEQWLHKVYSEIEERFLRQESGRARTMVR
jgi:predicted ribosome quality control (RQC) complex YloA/Tae2 family protein